MEFEVYPYKISQRTSYSKLRVINIDTNQDLSNDIPKDAKEIIDEYKKQTAHPEKYFLMDGEKLLGLTDDAPFDLKYLFIPEGIEEIKEFAFEYKDIIGVVFPDTLRYIKNGAFTSCKGLKHVNLPDSLLKIGAGIFAKCENLTYIKLPPLEILPERLFIGCRSLENIDIPDTVKRIDRSCFEECFSLSDIKLPRELEVLADDVFSGCKNLSKIDLPASLSYIGDGVFVDCISLKEVIIPDNVYEIQYRAFCGCESLETVKLSNNIVSLPQNLFNNCFSLKNINIPDGIKRFGSNIFSGVKDIKEITIPRDLEAIFITPFSHSSIETLIFKSDLENLGALSFGTTDLTDESNIYKLVVSNLVKKITPDAFRVSGEQIIEFEYHGTKKEFEKFKKDNKELFKKLKNIQRLNIIEEPLKNEFVETISR